MPLPQDLPGTPYYDMLGLCLGLIALTWLLSIVTREYSWVDRSWSTAPIVYVAYVAYAEGFTNARLNVMALLVALWGVRLTFNFARKGGFSKGGEDYRWEVLKKKLGPVGFQLLNATFIAPFQGLLIWLFASPVHLAWLNRDQPFSVLDAIAATLFAVLLIGETIADEQMWRFQQEKKARQQGGESIKAPFYRHGLYRFSRHPNYFCEISMWWVLYLFAVASSGQLLHWTLAGAVALTVLFDSSVRFSESISLSKYPSYAGYQASVSRIIPWIAKR